jgi:hypothetical protein
MRLLVRSASNGRPIDDQADPRDARLGASQVEGPRALVTHAPGIERLGWLGHPYQREWERATIMGPGGQVDGRQAESPGPARSR